MGEKSQCKSRGRTLAHELGHMFSLKHKHDQKTDLMMWGNGIEVQIGRSTNLLNTTIHT